jgi:hypothetical protein
MFKIGSFEEEILQSMEKHLVSNQLESRHGFQKMAQATQYLNQAAAIFEKAQMYQAADQITQVLQEVAEALK